MRSQKKLDIFFIGVLYVAIIASCQKENTLRDNLPTSYAPLTQRLVDSTHKTIMAAIFADTSFQIAPGVVETDIHFLSMNGLTTRMFVLEVDLSSPNVDLRVATPFDDSIYELQTVPEMAKYIDVPDQVVVSGINGDAFNASTKEPIGIEFKNGIAIKEHSSDNPPEPYLGINFFAILSNGKPYIGSNSKDLDSIKPMIANATGAGSILLKNYIDISTIGSAADQSTTARTAIGYTSNDVVYFVIIDGVDFYHSNGINNYDLAKLMKALDVKDAVNLDGGSSSTLIVRHPRLEDTLEVRNQPSNGAPRAVANAWMIMSKKE